MWSPLRGKNENDGFLIIAGDKRVVPILANADSGSFNPNEPGPKVWIGLVMDQVEKGIKANPAQDKKIAHLWGIYEKKASKGSRTAGPIVPHRPPGRNCPPNYETTVGPFVQVKWGQGNGYNMFCPNRGCSGNDNCNNALAGCGPVAIAQVFNYYRKPATYTSDSGVETAYTFPLDVYRPSGSCNSTNSMDIQISKLIRDAGSKAGTHYGYPKCNSQTWREDVKTAFANAGYSNSGTRVGWDSPSNPTDSHLSQRLPVIMDGTSALLAFDTYHIWVLEGYHRYLSYHEPEDPYAQCYEVSVTRYYCNWGWRGNDNAWYALGHFTSSGQGFDTSLNVTYGMRP